MICILSLTGLNHHFLCWLQSAECHYPDCGEAAIVGVDHGVALGRIMQSRGCQAHCCPCEFHTSTWPEVPLRSEQPRPKGSLGAKLPAAECPGRAEREGESDRGSLTFLT